MSGDLQEQIHTMQQRVAELQQHIGESSSPQHQQEIIAVGLQELRFALEELQAANTDRQQQEFEQQQVLEERVIQRTESLQQLNEQLQNEIAEHQQTLNALRLSEERFRRAIVHAPIPIMIHGEDGEIFQINQVWTDITGYTQSDIPTIPDWTQRAYGERHEAVKAYIDQLYDRNTSVDDGEFSVTTRHGETRIWDFCSAPLGQLPDGKRLAISMARDITERKRAETALQESERRLSELAKNIPGSIYQFVLHTDGSYSFPYMSPGSKRVFELEVSEIEENPAILINLIHPDDRESFEDSVTASAETLDAWHWEGRCITPSGEIKWLRGASCPKKQANTDVLWDGLLMDITNCKNTELALQESELRFRQLADNISQVFWVATPDLSQMLYVSPACERIWGRSQAFLYQQPDSWLDAIHFDDRDRVSAVLKNEQDKPQSGEYRVVHPDGLVRWVRFYRFPARNQAGEIYRFVGIEEDFSDVYNELRLRQQAEEALAESEKRFRTSIENMLDCFGIYTSIRDESGEITDFKTEYLNVAACENDRVTKEEVIGKSLCELLPSHRETGLFDEYVQVVETGQPLVKEDVIYEEVYGQERLTKAYDIRIVKLNDGFVAIWRDITQRKLADEALRQSEENLRLVVQNMPVMLDAWDRNKTLIAWNGECERVTGYSAAEIVGNPHAFEILYPDTDYLERMMTQWQEQDSEYRDWEWTLTSKDGQIKTIAWYNISEGFPIQGWHGWAIGVEVTERKLAKEKMAQALQQERELNELKSNFIAIASHQFRTPLTTIFSSAELLERYRDRFSQEKQLTHLSRIQTAVQQMTVLLDDVLLVGKAGAGKLEFNPTPIDVVQFCEDLVEELQLSDKNQHIITFTHQGNCKKTVEGTTDLLPLLDEKYLRHIFDNLLSNAIKYSPDGGTVRFNLTCFCDRVKQSYSDSAALASLRTSERGSARLRSRSVSHRSADRAVFKVQDEGIGIPSEDVPRLFETFHRARNVGTIQGTGLGLAIVKQCVELHGGEILVESEVGRGTTFTVTLLLNYPNPSINEA